MLPTVHKRFEIGPFQERKQFGTVLEVEDVKKDDEDIRPEDNLRVTNRGPGVLQCRLPCPCRADEYIEC